MYSTWHWEELEGQQPRRCNEALYTAFSDSDVVGWGGLATELRCRAH